MIEEIVGYLYIGMHFGERVTGYVYLIFQKLGLRSLFQTFYEVSSHLILSPRMARRNSSSSETLHAMESLCQTGRAPAGIG